MSNANWLRDLEHLATRFGGGLVADLEGMTLAELWAVYTFLRNHFDRRFS